jgi:two-component system cell cycle sensor histidine kinase/response regulator CckA
MARDEAITAIRFPIRLLTVACLLTIMAFAWFVWIIFDARRDTEMFTDRLSRIEELRGVIVHLDEVLTMSARMAAVTGDLRWEERYHHFEPQLDAAIKETIKIGASSPNIKAATKTDEANIKLVEMENRAFALVRAGRKEAAQTVLFSLEYETQKQIYAEGITSFTSQIRREFDESMRDDQRMDLLSIIAAVVAGGISLAAWLSAVRGVRRWRARLLDSFHQRAEAEENLRKAHAELEVRVKERTREMQQVNHMLQTEVVEHTRAEEQLRVQATALNAAANAIVITDHKGTIQSVNPAFTALTGYTAPEAVGQNPRILKGGHQDEAFYQNLWQTISSGQVWSGELTNRRKDGSLYAEEMTITPLRNADGTIARYIAIKQDISGRKRAEEELRASQQIIEGIINAIPVRVFWKDKNLVYLGCNTAFARDAGFADPKDIVGKDDDQMAWRDRAELYRNDDRQVIESGCSKLLIEEPLTTPEGNTVTILTSKVPLRSSKGEISGVIGTFMDITDRKRTELALARLAAIIESSDDAIIGKDLNSIITSWNPGAGKLFGYTASDMVGTSIMRLLPADRQDEENQILWKIMRGESMQPFETLRQTKDGRLIDVSVAASPIKDATGKVIGVSKIARDITARKELEAQMERLRTEHALILNSIGEGVHWIDVDGRIKFENPAAAKMLGYEVSELIGKPAHATMHHTRADGAAYPQSECLIYATLRDGVVRRVTDEVFWRKDGSSFAVEYLCTPVCDMDGRSGGSVVIFTDITERKRLEGQVFQSQKLETVGKLAGGVAHEFNSILTTIIGQSELILGDLPSGHPLSQNAAGICRAAERAATLTRQLLAYGRRAFLRPESLDLNQVMASTEGMVRQLMGADVDVRIVPAEGLRAVKADAGQIEQVIMNLAMNARDAMSNGGKLTLETANVSFDQERVGRDPELKPGDYVMLAITDTGTGMSAEVKARVFEPFFTTKGVGQGTGLGLSTCYGIIKQSGGHISVYSEPGRGTTFKIYLPQVESQAKIPLQRLDSPDLPRGTETILLVEDDPALREMVAILLKRLGYTVLAAANGIEALSLKQQRDSGHIDLLFTDVVMPHMSGKELADRVQALHPHTRILFTSAYTENAIVHQGVLNPGVALLQKPFTPSALALKLREVMDQPGAPKPDPAQKTSGFTKISDEAKTPVN